MDGNLRLSAPRIHFQGDLQISAVALIRRVTPTIRKMAHEVAATATHSILSHMNAATQFSSQLVVVLCRQRQHQIPASQIPAKTELVWILLPTQAFQVPLHAYVISIGLVSFAIYQ